VSKNASIFKQLGTLPVRFKNGIKSKLTTGECAFENEKSGQENRQTHARAVHINGHYVFSDVLGFESLVNRRTLIQVSSAGIHELPSCRGCKRAIYFPLIDKAYFSKSLMRKKTSS